MKVLKEFTYKDHILEIKKKRAVSSGNLIYEGTARINGVKHIIRYPSEEKVVESFKESVDEKTTEWIDSTTINYRGYSLTIRKEFGNNNYLGISPIYKHYAFRCQGCSIKELKDKFKDKIDQILITYTSKEGGTMTTYEQVYKEWGRTRTKKITYKGRSLIVTIHPKAKGKGVFYIGSYCLKDYLGKWKDSTIESIHYDKIVSKFERFVDEYCTDWEARASYLYKGYEIRINQERGKEFYIGIVQFHKNSTYKHIADTREEVERCCKNRVGKVVYEKEQVAKKGMTESKEEKIKYLEDQLAQLSSELEKVKNEKDTLEYKGVFLDIMPDKDNWFRGIIRNSGITPPASSFYNKDLAQMKNDFEDYIDELERCAYLYCKLTNTDLINRK